jgi:hypothetical protein
MLWHCKSVKKIRSTFYMYFLQMSWISYFNNNRIPRICLKKIKSWTDKIMTVQAMYSGCIWTFFLNRKLFFFSFSFCLTVQSKHVVTLQHHVGAKLDPSSSHLKCIYFTHCFNFERTIQFFLFENLAGKYSIECRNTRK